MTYSLFLKNFQSRPHAVCVVTTFKQKYTYEQTYLRINAWANYLLAEGIEAADRVAVLLDNEDEHFFIALALDRINAQYVPFDRDIPKGQLLKDIDTLKLKKFIIEASLTDFVAILPLDLQLRISDEFWLEFKNFPLDAPASIYDNSEQKIIYIVSSSGSTGEKKWVPIAAAGLLYWAELEKTQCGFTSEDKVLVTRSPAYDARFSEYLRSLSVGMTLRLISWQERKDLTFILSVCQQENISCLLLIASQLGGQYHAIVSRLKEYGLKHLMVTGDACTIQLKTLCEELDINLWNCYGPTEATFGLSILKVNGISALNEAGDAIVPIGKPLSPMNYQIKDGRLFIDSPFLTPGYLGKASVEGFVFQEGIRLFDTGDAFTERDGFLFFGGRASLESHCKVEGVKVTSALIERCLFNYNADNPQAPIDFVVLIKQNLERFKPVAYLVLTANFNKEIFLSFLKYHLKKEEFPLLVILDCLPRLSTSQKIDIKLLAEREDDFWEFFKEEKLDVLSCLEDKKEALKIKIQSICANVLKKSNPSLNANLNFLGLSSLSAAEIVARIHKEIFAFSYQELLNLPELTISHMGDALFRKMTSRFRGFFTTSDTPLTASPALALLHTLKLASNPQGNIFFLPALLGEGNFSYRELSKLMGDKFVTKNIYGLTEPAIYDETLLPKNLSMAVERYVRAIKIKQPEGPYELLGFSFGATLVYEVASLLEQQGQCATVHLVDGFPPCYYQALDNVEHAKLIVCIANFLVEVCNNRFYQEKVTTLNVEKMGWSLEASQIIHQMQAIVSTIPLHCILKKMLEDLQKLLLKFLMSIEQLPLEKKIAEIHEVFTVFGSKIVAMERLFGPHAAGDFVTLQRFLEAEEQCLLKFVRNHVPIFSLEKREQVKKILSALQVQLKNPAAKKMIQVAKKHLLFILDAPEPHKKLSSIATLYLTNSEQPYAKAINSLSDFKIGTDKDFYFWNRYFYSITRNGVQLSGEHLSVIRPSEEEYQLGKTATFYWPIERAQIFYNMDKRGFEKFGFHSFYSYQQEGDHGQLNLFFLKASAICSFKAWLLSYPVQISVVYSDATLYKSLETRYKDVINIQKASLFIKGPLESLKLIKTRLSSKNIYEQDFPKLTALPFSTVERDKENYFNIELVKSYGPLFTFSFPLCLSAQKLFDLIAPQFEPQCSFCTASKPPHHLLLEFALNSAKENALQEAIHFVAQVITVLQHYLEEPLLELELSETSSFSMLKR